VRVRLTRAQFDGAADLLHGRAHVPVEQQVHPGKDQVSPGEAVVEGQRLERLEALLDQGVRDRLVADVPVGVFLSGGIDSSLIAAFVARHAPGLTALTVAVPGTGYDETPAARTLARSLGLKHEVIALDEAALLDAFAVLDRRMDEPLADASLLPTWVLCRAARRHVTVALGGDGADELFAGYISFRANRAAARLARIPARAGAAARRLLAGLPQGSAYMNPLFLLRQLSQGFSGAAADLQHFFTGLCIQPVKTFLNEPPFAVA
jgi:asparagine synthase (glutamine-hydrolysing)